MSKNIQLAIANPCHENWDQMTPNEQGRFCESCQKQVVDFTDMSDSQLAAFFKKPAAGSVCGRFYDDQLGRDIEITRKRTPWIRYFFQFALPAFLLSARATAQGKVIPTIISPSNRLPDTVVKKTMGRPDNAYSTDRNKQVSINGKVVDNENNPVRFASVMIKGTNKGTMADSAGVFNLSNIAWIDGMILEVSSVGFTTAEKQINKQEEEQLVVLLSQPIMGEVVVVAYPYSRCRRITGMVGVIKVVKEVATIKPPQETPAMIKVYPNPVQSGSSINIGCQKLAEGYYNIQLSNQAGQQVLNQQAWVDEGVQVLNIDLPHVASGVYFLKMTNKETSKRFTQKIVIE